MGFSLFVTHPSNPIQSTPRNATRLPATIAISVGIPKNPNTESQCNLVRLVWWGGINPKRTYIRTFETSIEFSKSLLKSFLHTKDRSIDPSIHPSIHPSPQAGRQVGSCLGLPSQTNERTITKTQHNTFSLSYLYYLD